MPEEPERGRSLKASGRGGIGNLVQGEFNNDREMREQLSTVHVGRGGAGNVRSPSRDPVERKLREEEKFRALEEQDKMQSHELHSNVHMVGRGGVGNLPHTGGRGAPPPVSHGSESGTEERGRGLGHVASMLRFRSRSRSRDVRAHSIERPRASSHLDQVAE